MIGEGGMCLVVIPNRRCFIRTHNHERRQAHGSQSDVRLAISQENQFFDGYRVEHQMACLGGDIVIERFVTGGCDLRPFGGFIALVSLGGVAQRLHRRRRYQKGPPVPKPLA